MAMRVGTGLSTLGDLHAAATDAAVQARRGLDGEACDLVVLFASGGHLVAPEATLEAVHEVLAPTDLIGCGADGVLGAGHEVEDGTGIVVWAASLDGGTAQTFHATVEPVEGGGALGGMVELTGAAGVLLLADPLSFPTDPVLRFLADHVPTVPLLGGLSSARTADDGGALFLDDEVLDEGAVGVRLDGVEMLPCVSQGAEPVGPELTITAAEGGLISELAGKPALEKLRETIEALSEAERTLVAGGLLVGVVAEPNKPDYVRGDFLVRGLAGADPESGSIAVAGEVRPGQVIRLHARDAEIAERDLEDALRTRMEALGGVSPAGALVFACNGRGRSLFGSPDHDAQTVERVLGGTPSAGFFAAGEIGPVGGQAFVHAFTATVALFSA